MLKWKNSKAIPATLNKTRDTKRTKRSNSGAPCFGITGCEKGSLNQAIASNGKEIEKTQSEEISQPSKTSFVTSCVTATKDAAASVPASCELPDLPVTIFSVAD
jgi:hypothetical protein